MNQVQEQFKQAFSAVAFDAPLSQCSTFVIGGPADFFYEVTDPEEIHSLIEFAKSHSIPYFIIGGGSNLLFHDNGFRGLIIKIKTDKISFNDDTATADSGVHIAKLIIESIQNGLSGLEKWVGLPGTVGGAVRGNAGCNGLETSDILLSAQILDPKTGRIHAVKPRDLDFSYRHSALKETKEIVLSATFQLKKSAIPDMSIGKDTMRQIQAFRSTAQPKGASSGSFFKNPSPEKPAGLLIDKAGIKGTQIGHAQISPLHGNFFLNLGGATAQDILSLAKLAKEKVKSQFNIDLEEEVQVIPEHEL